MVVCDITVVTPGGLWSFRELLHLLGPETPEFLLLLKVNRLMQISVSPENLSDQHFFISKE